MIVLSEEIIRKVDAKYIDGLRDDKNYLIGQNEELKRQIESLKEELEKEKVDARKWRRLERGGDDWADFAIDEATDGFGKQVKFTVDLAAGGEPWLPGVRRRRGWVMDLVSTVVSMRRE